MRIFPGAGGLDFPCDHDAVTDGCGRFPITALRGKLAERDRRNLDVKVDAIR
jgi:hypothetical protein